MSDNDPAPPASAVVELLALRVLQTAVRCREIGGGAVTYRRSVALAIPGHRLTVAPERRWRFRRTDMLGGRLLHREFSMRALAQAGFERPEPGPDGLRSPGESDPRLLRGLADLEAGDWIAARCSLLDVLEDTPGALAAHAALGHVHAAIAHRDVAIAHFTAAVRLGAGALRDERCLPLDPRRVTERAFLRALLGRAHVLAESGRADAAAADLRRAIAWDPGDTFGARSELAALQAQAALAAS